MKQGGQNSGNRGHTHARTRTPTTHTHACTHVLAHCLMAPVFDMRSVCLTLQCGALQANSAAEQVQRAGKAVGVAAVYPS